MRWRRRPGAKAGMREPRAAAASGMPWSTTPNWTSSSSEPARRHLRIRRNAARTRATSSSRVPSSPWMPRPVRTGGISARCQATAWNYEPAVGLMMATLPIDGRGQARRPQRAEERLRLSPGREDRRVHLGSQLRAGQLGERPRRRDRATDLRPCCTLLGSGRRRDPRSSFRATAGAHDWTALAFDPQKNVLFIPAMTMPERLERTASGEYSYDYSARQPGRIRIGRRSQSSLRGIRSPRARCGGSAMRCH